MTEQPATSSNAATLLTKEESLILLFEFLVEYRKEVATVIDNHAALIKSMEGVHLPDRVLNAMQHSTTGVLAIHAKMLDVKQFIDTLSPEYLKVTKPKKH